MLLSKRDIITDSYDVIVVGGGLAGMTAANKLGKSGRKVLLLEAHNKLGGFATWFKRTKGEHIFDISLHGFPVGMIKTCKKYWSRDIASRIVQLKKVRFVNKMYDLESDFTIEDFSRILRDVFKVDDHAVSGFFQELSSMNFYDPLQMSNRELFQKHFPYDGGSCNNLRYRVL